jgi:hypothetical protein
MLTVLRPVDKVLELAAQARTIAVAPAPAESGVGVLK